MTEKTTQETGPHGIKVGDIFDDAWGYDQTNIDFYQVVKVTRKTIVVREIAQRKQETGFMSGKCEPTPNHFTGPEVRKVPKLTTDGRVFLPSEYGWCEPWEGNERFWSSYH